MASGNAQILDLTPSVSSFIGATRNLTLDNSDAVYGGTGGLTSSATFPSVINLNNGSTWISQFVNVHTSLFVDGTSSIELKGGGDPINSATGQSSVNLALGAQLIFRNTGELDDRLNDSGTGDIWVNGTRVTLANKNDYLTTTDNLTYTAVPEPSSTTLLGLGGLALILRRRK